jgi:hypothetical protein
MFVILNEAIRSEESQFEFQKTEKIRPTIEMTVILNNKP